MPFKDLREFVQTLQEMDQIKRLDGASPDLEIGAVTQLAGESPRCPALMFDGLERLPKGYRILTNAIANKTRERLVFGVPPELSDMDASKLWKDKLKQYEPVVPKEVAEGPVKENALLGDKVDLRKMPWPRWHEDDGGFCHHGTFAITRDPELGALSSRLLSLVLVDRNTLCVPAGRGEPVWQKYWQSGKACPVAISLGHDPALFAAALISDRGYGFAGWMRGAPVEVTQGESSGLPIPAAAEAVLEGEIAAPAAGQQPAAPTVKIQSMLFRSEPMILGNPPCPGAHYGVLSSKAAFVWNELEALGIPNIAAVNHYGWGCAIVAIKQPYPGHVKRVAHAVLGSSVGRDVRLVIVVDDDIDPYNLEKVFWAIATRYEPEFALDIVRRLWSDGSERTGFTNQKGGASNSTTIIDACRPYHWMDKFPRTTDISEELFRKTDKKWRKVLSQHR